MTVPLSELEARLTKVQAELAAQELDAALIVQTADLYYLTGTAQQAHLLLPVEGEPLLLVRRDPLRARAESPLPNVHSIASLREVAESAARLGLPASSRLGLELDVLPLNHYRRYEQLFPQAELLDCSPVLREVRSVKSPWEIERLRQAGRQSEAGFAIAAQAIRPGISESEVASLIVAALLKAGHPGLLRMRGLNQEMLLAHVYAGPDAGAASYADSPLTGLGRTPAVPQGASDRPIQRGEAVVIDIGGALDGYAVDQTRTFSLGPLPSDLREAHQACRDIKDELRAAAVPGARAGDLYALAANRAADLGYADSFMGAVPNQVSFVGHGIGLEIDELPVLGRGLDRPLAAGNVIAVEPKILLAGRGAVGVEDTCLVTPSGLEPLTTGDDALVEL